MSASRPAAELESDTRAAAARRSRRWTRMPTPKCWVRTVRADCLDRILILGGRRDAC